MPWWRGAFASLRGRAAWEKPSDKKVRLKIIVIHQFLTHARGDKFVIGRFEQNISAGGYDSKEICNQHHFQYFALLKIPTKSSKSK
jgi:hypothetical protein